MNLSRLFQPANSTPVADNVLTEHNAVVSALLEGTADLANATDGLAIIRKICNALVTATPHIRLAWAWIGSPESKEIRPMICAGPAAAYAQNLVIQRSFMVERGPAYQALLNNRETFMRISPLSPYAPWREAFREYRFQVAVAMPLRLPDKTDHGILVFYADEEDYFELIGMEPFRAIARLSEVALTHTALRIQLEKQASTDPLTGLLNRRTMNEALERQLALAKRHQSAFSVVMFDLDYFKSVNDRLGHAVGDEVIRHVARLGFAHMRNEDQLSRWGGEEFLYLLPEVGREGAAAAAEKLRQAIAVHFNQPGAPVQGLTASFGVAAFEPSSPAIDSLLSRVDRALYMSKAAGRNQVTVR